jgi:DNA-binding XRE family transcriptional regulator
MKCSALQISKIDMTGPEFRTGRETLGLTQTQIGVQLGVQRNAVAVWERNGPTEMAALCMIMLLKYGQSCQTTMGE